MARAPFPVRIDMSGASAFVHPLSSLRSKLEELVEQGDAEQLERLLEGEDMPLLGGHEEPAELLHRALLRQPYQPDLVLSLAPVLGSVLKRQAAALAKAALPPPPALGRAVRNALLLAELLPPATPIFEGVAAFYEPLAGYAIDSEQPEDRYTLGLRLRAALCCQQDDDRFADFWSALLESKSSTDLMDGLRGLLWLPVVSEPSGMGLLAKGLELFGCNALQHSDHPLLLGWAVATLADALPHSPGFWQEHLAPLAAGWPPELRTAFQKRWPTVELAEAKQAEVVSKEQRSFRQVAFKFSLPESLASPSWTEGPGDPEAAPAAPQARLGPSALEGLAEALAAGFRGWQAAPGQEFIFHRDLAELRLTIDTAAAHLLITAERSSAGAEQAQVSEVYRATIQHRLEIQEAGIVYDDGAAEKAQLRAEAEAQQLGEEELRLLQQEVLELELFASEEVSALLDEALRRNLLRVQDDLRRFEETANEIIKALAAMPIPIEPHLPFRQKLGWHRVLVDDDGDHTAPEDYHDQLARLIAEG